MAKSDPAPSGPTFDFNKDDSKDDKNSLGLDHLSFFDNLVYALTGTPRDSQTPEDRAKHERKSAEAGKAAAAFANSGGDAADAYMGAPGAGGGGINLSDIIKLVGMIA